MYDGWIRVFSPNQSVLSANTLSIHHTYVTVISRANRTISHTVGGRGDIHAGKPLAWIDPGQKKTIRYTRRFYDQNRYDLGQFSTNATSTTKTHMFHRYYCAYTHRVCMYVHRSHPPQKV